ncbi:MAG TPA: DUF6159 family protein [Desulfuromonadaceae bacterium]|nr:DUF6159 family protein [Desulfuromonadaceae bacterium]
MNKFMRSWQLFKSSLSIMNRDKQLLLFPIVTFICSILIVLFFLVPVTLRPTGYAYTSAQHWHVIGHSLFVPTTDFNGRAKETLSPMAMGYLAIMYFISMFVATFFNVAFFHEILAALKGDSVSISRGLKFAVTRWKAILMWTLFAGIVGLIIKQIEERLGLVGRIIGRLIGIAWSVAAVFVIPLIVQEETSNPLTMLKNSAGILRRTWGESLIGFVGIRLVSGIILILSMGFLFAAGAIAATTHQWWIATTVFITWFITMFVLSYLSNVASQIYKGALYLYAKEGVVCEPYSEEMLDSAWKFKKE